MMLSQALLVNRDKFWRRTSLTTISPYQALSVGMPCIPLGSVSQTCRQLQAAVCHLGDEWVFVFTLLQAYKLCVMMFKSTTILLQ